MVIKHEAGFKPAIPITRLIPREGQIVTTCASNAHVGVRLGLGLTIAATISPTIFGPQSFPMCAHHIAHACKDLTI